MPAKVRARVRRPMLSCSALKDLQGMLCNVIREQEAAWERRNLARPQERRRVQRSACFG
jgi:hypothetical protein